MSSTGKTKLLNKTILSGAISTALSIGIGLGVTTVSNADIYDLSYTGLFTMLSPTGIALQNTSYPFYGDATWGYGFRSQISGTMRFDTATGAGSGTVQPFNFFNKGSATASGVTFQAIGGSLMLGNMNFNWNNTDISTNIVLDGSGLFSAIGGDISAIGTVVDQVFCGDVVGAPCSLPASDGSNKGKFPIGPVPIATSSFNVTGSTGVGTTLGQLSLGTDDGIGGTPMDNGPFSGFNANFDMLSVEVTNFTDNTDPVIMLNGSTPVILTEGGPAYVELGATCTDGPPLDTDLDTSVVIGGDTVNTALGDVYVVTYDCKDAALNEAAQVTRTVGVVSPGVPLIAYNGLNPLTHECAVSYMDEGAICADFEDGIIIGTDNPVAGDLFSVDASNVVSNVGTPGDYQVVASCRDSDLTSPPDLIRNVAVVDTTAPDILITGLATLDLVSSTPENLAPYVDQGATVSDSCDLTVSAVTVTGDAIDLTVPDDGMETLVYKVKYEATDGINPTSLERTVNVTRSQPVITLLDKDGLETTSGDIVVVSGSVYTEFGMNIHDAQEGDVPAATTASGTGGTGGALSYTISGSVDTNTPGPYTITYTAVDSTGLGNNATPVERIVTVADANTTGIGNFTMLDASGFRIGGTNDVTYIWDGKFTSSAVDPASVDVDGFGVPTDTTVVMTYSTPTPFNGFNWIAKNVRVFQGPAKLKFDVTCLGADYAAGDVVCNRPLSDQSASKQFVKIELAAGEIGAHVLFDWGSDNGATPCGVANCDIDVVQAWTSNGVWADPDGDGPTNNLFLDGPFLLEDADGNPAPPALDTTWFLVSTDVNGENGPDGINGERFIDGAFIGFRANFNFGPGDAGVIVDKPVTQIDEVTASFSMGLWSLLAGLFSVFGLRRINNKK